MRVTDVIIQVVAEAYRVRPQTLCNGSLKRVASAPRHVAMSLCRRQIMYNRRPMPLTVIAARFGLVNHTSVIHAVRKVAADCAADPDLAGRFDALLARVVDALAAARETKPLADEHLVVGSTP